VIGRVDWFMSGRKEEEGRRRVMRWGFWTDALQCYAAFGAGVFVFCLRYFSSCSQDVMGRGVHLL
jgi:hypothetical protein